MNVLTSKLEIDAKRRARIKKTATAKRNEEIISKIGVRFRVAPGLNPGNKQKVTRVTE